MFTDALTRRIPGFADSPELQRAIAEVAPALAEHRYLRLTTFRKNGTAVATPVWFAPDDGRLLVITEETSFKVRRINNNPSVLIAPCDARGRPLGDNVAATAEVLPDAELSHTREVLTARYGVQSHAITLAIRAASLIPGRAGPSRVGIALRL